jgi:hypothetical protein
MPNVDPFPVRDREVTHVVIELFGGDNNLSSYVLEDLQEMAAGNSGRFATLGLADFENEGGQVVELSPEAGHRVIASLGEVDTGDPETLASFIARALVSYPATTRKALGFWDHGTGVFNEDDPNELLLERGLRRVSRSSRSRSRPARNLFIPRAKLAAHPRLRAMLHDDTNGGVLTNYEAYGVVKTAFQRAGVQQVDMIFSDTCLNGMIEVLDQFQEFTQVVVGSEDLEPGDGWDYQQLFRLMSEHPPADGLEWGKQAVQAFEEGYRNRPGQHPCTLGAFRSQQRVTAAFTGLVDALKPEKKTGFGWVQEARTYAQAFARHDTYDIKDFAGRLRGAAGSEPVRRACDAVAAAFDEARVHAVALGEDVQQSHGLAFWLPSNARAFREVAPTYAKLRFDQATGWTGYLRDCFAG